jgi:hypothetical protein
MMREFVAAIAGFGKRIKFVYTSGFESLLPHKTVGA